MPPSLVAVSVVQVGMPVSAHSSVSEGAVVVATGSAVAVVAGGAFRFTELIAFAVFGAGFFGLVAFAGFSAATASGSPDVIAVAGGLAVLFPFLEQMPYAKP